MSCAWFFLPFLINWCLHISLYYHQKNHHHRVAQNLALSRAWATVEEGGCVRLWCSPASIERLFAASSDPWCTDLVARWVAVYHCRIIREWLIVMENVVYTFSRCLKSGRRSLNVYSVSLLLYVYFLTILKRKMFFYVLFFTIMWRNTFLQIFFFTKLLRKMSVHDYFFN